MRSLGAEPSRRAHRPLQPPPRRQLDRPHRRRDPPLRPVAERVGISPVATIVSEWIALNSPRPSPSPPPTSPLREPLRRAIEIRLLLLRRRSNIICVGNGGRPWALGLSSNDHGTMRNPSIRHAS